MIASEARERAKELLRSHRPFVWNATNVTVAMRESLVSLFEAYRARVRIVWLETQWSVLLQRNCAREAVVPQKVIERLLGKLSVPEVKEATHVEWIALP